MRRFFRPPNIERTKHFNADVMAGKEHGHHIFGKAIRFNSDKTIRSYSVRKYFTDKLSHLLRPTDKVLDSCCGPGIFLPVLSPLCRELVGLDVTPAFIEESRLTIERHQLQNTHVVEARSETMPFPDSTFDAIVVVDALHHIYYLEESIAELHRVSRPGARIIIFEPNILNPAILITHLFDMNEWGALGLCRRSVYRQLLENRFTIDALEHSSLVIGPDSPMVLHIADILDRGALSSMLGWLRPKIFISMRNKKKASRS